MLAYLNAVVNYWSFNSTAGGGRGSRGEWLNERFRRGERLMVSQE